MKGVVFTELLEMVEKEFGDEVADQIIEQSSLASGEAYAAVGTYDHQEILELVTPLSETIEIPVSDLVKTFGSYLFGRFLENYPIFFDGVTSTFDFLKTIEGHIQVEVRKLYPDAELPTFEYVHSTPNHLELIYQSTRPFGDLAEGLLTASIIHFGESIELQRKNLTGKFPFHSFEGHKKR